PRGNELGGLTPPRSPGPISVQGLGAATPVSFRVESFFVLRSTTRTRWALVSATYSLPRAWEMPAGSWNSGAASQPSGSPPRNVLHSRVLGSSTLILLL